MIDDNTLFSLIKNGESSSLDFKRELDLNTARPKAEFIKDVIAMANSNRDGGYLLLGISDDKTIVGIQNIEDERIQQICRTYINPPVIIECSLKQMEFEDQIINIGVVFIRPTRRPHKVSKSINDIEQETVFVRRGSIISKASPEEIISMTSDDNPISREANEYKKAAEIHYKIGNFENALSALNRAIEIHPDSESFLFRAKVNFDLRRSCIDSDNYTNLEEAIARDLGFAIEIADSEEIIQIARNMRWKHFYGVKGYPIELWWEDLRYELDKKSMVERGEWIYNEVNHWDSIYDGFGDEAFALLAFSLLNEALESGYKNPELLFLLAEAHYYSRNYFDALKFVKQYLSSEELTNHNLHKALIFKGKILIKLGKISEARGILRNSQQVNQEFFENYFVGELSRDSIVEEFLYRFTLENELGCKLEYPLYQILKILALVKGRELSGITTSKDSKKLLERETQLDLADRKFPGLKSSLRKLLSSNEWEIINEGDSGVVIELQLPSIDRTARIKVASHDFNEEYLKMKMIIR